MKKRNSIWLIILLGFNFCFAQSDSIKIKNLYDEARGNVYNNPKEALRQIDILIKKSQENVNQLVDIHILKATAYSNLRDNEQALENLNKTYELVNILKKKEQKVSVLHRIASIYQNLKLYDKSLIYLNEAEKIINQFDKKQDKLEAISYNYTVRGLIFKDLNNFESAVDYFNKGIESYNQVENVFVANSNKSVIHYNLGYCYLKTDIKASEKAFTESYRLAQLVGTKILLAYSLKGLGEYYFKINDYKTSNEKLNEAIILFQNLEDPILKRNVYSLVGLNSIALQEWQQYEKADSLSNIYNKKVLDSENKTIGLAIKSIKEEAKKSIKTSSSNIILISIALFIILLIISILFFIKKDKINKKIVKKQEELTTILHKK